LRKFLLAAMAVSLAAPVFAEQAQIPEVPNADRVPESVEAPLDPRDEAIIRSMPQQREIEAVGDAVDRTLDAVLDVPIGPIVEAANPGKRMSRREREETLGDRAGRDDPYFRDRMRDQIAIASVAVGVLAEQMAVMAPVFRRTLEDVERRVEDAARGLPPRDYDRRDPRDD